MEMPKIKSFQYTPCTKVRALSRFLPKIHAVGCIPILDIEDSVQNSLRPNLTHLLKAKARSALYDAVESNRFEINNDAGLRINANWTSEYSLDLDLLSALSERIDLHSIWLPMVESIADIQLLERDLDHRQVRFGEIVPIVETVKGRTNLAEICSLAGRHRVQAIHYGHYDYSLDLGGWPMARQDEVTFWSFVREMVEIIEAADLDYVHTPFGELRNVDAFHQISSCLMDICTRSFARTSLNFFQSQLIPEYRYEKYKPQERRLSDAEKLDLARSVIENFEINQSESRSFSSKSDVFITPHEYKLAKKFCDNLISK